MHTISINDMKAVIQYVVFGQGRVAMFWGPPGVGKSEGILQGALEYAQQLYGPTAMCVEYRGRRSLDKARAEAAEGRRGVIICDVRLGQYDSVDLRGFPGIDEDTKTTVWYPPGTLPFDTNPVFDGFEDWTILIFFDEANSANAAVSAVAYQITNDKRCGEHALRPNVCIAMAGNREGDRGVTNKQPLPLANRLTHFEIAPEVDALCLYAQAKKWPPEFVAFLQFRKPLISTFDPAKPEKAFATPRTWEHAMGYYADKRMPEHIKMAAMAGAVGDGPAAEFWGFVKSWQKIAAMMPKIMKEPDKAPVPEEASLRYALSVAISGALDPNNATILNTYLVRMDAEFVVLAWQLAVKRDPKMFETREFVDFSKRYKTIFA